MINNDKILIYLGSDNFSLNLGKKLYQISVKKIGKCNFILDQSIKDKKNFKSTIKNKVFKNFSDFRKKDNFKNYNILINLWGGKIFSEKFLNKFKKKINLHPSYLPYWRGKNSAFYANTFKVGNGATLHEMNKKIDYPNIYVREKTKVFFEETGFQTYVKSVQTCLKIYEKYIKSILNGKLKPKKISFDKKKNRVYFKKEFPKNYNIKIKKNSELFKFIGKVKSLDFPLSKCQISMSKKNYNISIILKELKKK